MPVAGVETLEEYAAATAGCTRCRLAQGPDKMTYLELNRPERFALSVPGTPDGLVRELFGGSEATCES